jgi:hypothetical protein
MPRHCEEAEGRRSNLDQFSFRGTRLLRFARNDEALKRQRRAAGPRGASIRDGSIRYFAFS